MKAVSDRTGGPEGDGPARARPAAKAEGPGAEAAAGRPPGGTLTSRGLLRLQRSAGNAAVARLVARARTGAPGTTAAGPAAGPAALAGGAGPAPTEATAPGDLVPGPDGPVVQRRAAGGDHPSPPPAPAPIDPHGDPRFAKVTQQVGGTARALRAHPAGRAEARKASAAAVAPAGDKEAQAKAAQADKMAGAKPAGFDKAAFMAAVRAAIAAKAPKNLDEAANFAASGRADGVKAEVMGNVTKGKEASAKDIASKTGEPPDPSAAKDKPVTPLPPDPVGRPATPAAGQGMPAKAPAEQTDLGAGKAETDAEMAEADVSEHQLATSNEPELTGALEAKQAGEEHSATAPGPVRDHEAATLDAAAGGADASAKATVGQMLASKTGAVGHAGAGKSAAKSKDEAARARITGEIRKIFDTTKADVDKILADLDTQVATRFDEGEKAAKAAFTADHTARMDAYKDERYSGLLGKGRWLRDKFAGLPAEANNIFLASRKLYEAQMEVVISGVADLIGRELTRAKDRIAQGRQQITAFVASQPKELAKVAGQAATDIGDKFDQLESDVDDKQGQLVDDLASRYIEARTKVDDEIKELQEANKGLWDKAKDAIAGAIRTILKLKDMLLGVLARAAGAVTRIIKDPIGFLGNLVNAVKSGVTNFAANIVDHLKKGLQGWLFGALADAGVEIPESFDLKGIIKLVLSILGMTWTRIRTKLVKRIGEPAMGAVEKGVDLFKTLATEGVGGLWRFLVDKLSDLKDTVMSAIQDFVVVKIVKAGITWLISALNPAAAFIKACKMIYDVVMFFVEKGSQIKEFVDSVLDSIESIVGGGVGAVAKHIENTLARILPLLLGFLASLLGLGGISEKVKEILQKVQKPVEKAVDFVVNGALKLAAPIIAMFKRGAGWVKGKVKAGADWAKGKVEGAKAWARGKVEGAKSRLGLGPKPRADLPEDKQQHVSMAAREIEPKARALLDKGVSGPALESRLRGWKTEYQLADLWIEHHGGNFDIKAKVNPTANIITNAVDLVGHDISRILRQVGEELLSDPAVRAEVETIRQTREAQVQAGGGTRDQPITRPAQSPAAEAAALRPPPEGSADPRRARQQHEQIEMGGQQVSEQQSYSAAPGHIKTSMSVTIDGRLSNHARYTPEVQAALSQMEGAGISRSQVQDGIFNLLANRPPGPAFAADPTAAAQLASITRLMFVVEPARNPAAFATSFMGATMAGDAAMPIEDMATAANPMHARGAAARARTGAANLEAEAEARVGGKRGLDAELMLLAERDVVIGYLENLVRSKELSFDSQHAVERWLREQFRDHLVQRLRAALTRAPTPGA